ncbi:MAG: heme A synthase [Phycisphaerae bacterium]
MTSLLPRVIDLNLDLQQPTYRRSLHTLAVVVALATLPLVFVGGAVTSKNAGLAVPDWPLSFGQVNPPGWWRVDNVLFEHGHRLLGATVGLLVIALVVWTHRLERRRWVRRFSLVLLGAVVLQGILGGLRVTEISTKLAVVHGCLAQVFFCLAGAMACVTSPRWIGQPPADPSPEAAGVRRACLVVAAAVFVQLVLGAMLRHLGWGLLYHILWALVVLLLTGALAIRLLADHGQRPLIRRPVHALAGFVVLQMMAGPMAWFVTQGYSDDRTATLAEWLLPTLHVALGALALLSAVATVLGAFRSLALPWSPGRAVPGAEVQAL